MAVELSALKMYWAYSLTGMHDLAMRQIIDGADTLVSITSGPTKIEVTHRHQAALCVLLCMQHAMQACFAGFCSLCQRVQPPLLLLIVTTYLCNICTLAVYFRLVESLKRNCASGVFFLRRQTDIMTCHVGMVAMGQCSVG